MSRRSTAVAQVMPVAGERRRPPGVLANEVAVMHPELKHITLALLEDDALMDDRTQMPAIVPLLPAPADAANSTGNNGDRTWPNTPEH